MAFDLFKDNSYSFKQIKRQPNMSYQNLRFLMTEIIYRRNFNHLIRNTHFKTLFYHHRSTYSTLTNMSALQCPDVQTCFLSEYMLGRWIAKIKKILLFYTACCSVCERKLWLPFLDKMR